MFCSVVSSCLDRGLRLEWRSNQRVVSNVQRIYFFRITSESKQIAGCQS